MIDYDLDDWDAANYEELIADREEPDHLETSDSEDSYEPDFSLDDTPDDDHWLAGLEADYAEHFDMISDEWNS